MTLLSANQPGAMLEPDRVRGYNVHMSQALSNDGGFVGRRDEMAELKAALDDAMAGHGRLVMLVGEPGIGKTRMAQESASLAQTRGAQVLWGRCCEEEGAPPFWPWINPFGPMSKSEAARGCIWRWAPAPLTSQRSSPKHAAS